MKSGGLADKAAAFVVSELVLAPGAVQQVTHALPRISETWFRSL
jgi:hypothetical protein